MTILSLRTFRNTRYIHSSFPPALNKYSFYDAVLKSNQKNHSSPSGTGNPKLPSNANSTQKTFVFPGNAGTNEDVNEKLKAVFGGRLEGKKVEKKVSTSRYSPSLGHEYKIAGILIPSKPQEPDNCCMSGCINCVWELYNDDIKEYKRQRRLAAKELIKRGGIWPLKYDPPVRLLKKENLPKEIRNRPVKDSDEELGQRWESVSMDVFSKFEKKLHENKA